MLQSYPDEFDDEMCDDGVRIYDGSEGGSIYTNHHSIPKSNIKTIRPDLEKIGLAESIINQADNIYKQMNIGTKRGKRRKQLIFFCIFSAYNQQNIAVDPVELIKRCGLDKSSISKSLSMCSPIQTDYDAPLVRKIPQDFINIHYDKLKEIVEFPEDALDDIYDITEEVLEQDLDLHDDKPQTVAAAILDYYLQLQGYCLDKSKYDEIFGSSDMTINKIKKKVIQAHNS